MRFHDWPERLFKTVRRAKDLGFSWGKNDCALFACDCALAITGVDHAAKFRGTYKTKAGAFLMLRKIEDVKSLLELADKYLGERIELSQAKRGDVVALMMDNFYALGVVTGSNAVFVTLSGTQTVPVSSCLTAWEVA